jgi:aryl-alcohol dehydrogenase-like predicted oxidoreductase
MGRVIRTEKTERDAAVVDAVIDVSVQLGKSPAEIALAWLCAKARESTTSIIPIIGPRTVEQLDNNLLALELTLPQEVLGRLDHVSKLAPGVPFEVNRETFPRMMGGRPESVNMPAFKVA